MRKSDDKQKPARQITSLREYRRQRNKQARKRYLTPEERLCELEADTLRLVEFSLELNEKIDSQYRITRGILRVLRRLSGQLDDVLVPGEARNQKQQ
jgi:hypothetical protein